MAISEKKIAVLDTGSPFVTDQHPKKYVGTR